MKSFLANLVATAVAFVVAFRFLPGLTFPAADLKDPQDDLVKLAAVALLFGVVNGLVAPVVKLLSLPISFMTMGLFGFVVNGGMLLLVAGAAEQFKLGLKVGDFPPDLATADTLVWAVIGAVVIGLVTTIVSVVLGGKR